MRFRVAVRKLNVMDRRTTDRRTDRRTDGLTDGRGALQYLLSPGLRRRRENVNEKRHMLLIEYLVAMETYDKLFLSMHFLQGTCYKCDQYVYQLIQN